MTVNGLRFILYYLHLIWESVTPLGYLERLIIAGAVTIAVLSLFIHFARKS